ncbi:MAG: hypothetical protein JRI23_03900 [Deltaproteobacteria bacterium]|jgi:hypothetical protein|nr:hypothetical protein [Deltaproteobacteria bacterium]MBW2530672.1 hypothetical protein [Deltaproteobacteria bacterium]
MTERQMREAIRVARAELERKARDRARRTGGLVVYPLMVGAGLMVAHCDSSDDETISGNEPPYGVGTTTYTGTASGTSTGTGSATGGGGGGGEGASGGAGGAVDGGGGAAGAGGV